MIFLRDRQLCFERSVTGLHISYRWSPATRWLSLVACTPALTLVGLCASLWGAKPAVIRPADLVLVAVFAALSVAGIYLIVYVWLTTYEILATPKDLTVKAGPVPGFKSKSLKAATILQLVVLNSTGDSVHGDLVAVLSNYSVFRLITNIPSEFAALELFRELNVFYGLPLRQIEGWRTPFSTAYDVASVDAGTKTLPASRSPIEEVSEADSLQLSGKFSTVWSPIVGLFAGFLCMIGLVGATLPDIEPRSNVPFFVMLALGLAVAYLLLPLCGNRFTITAVRDSLTVATGPFPLIPLTKFDVKSRRRFFLYGKRRQSLWMADSDGFVTRIFQGFGSNEAAALARDALNRYYRLPQEDIVTFSSLSDGHEPLRIPHQGVTIRATVDGVEILVANNTGVAWGKVAFLLGVLVVLLTLIVISKEDASTKSISAIGILALVVPQTYLELAFGLAKTSIQTHRDSLVIAAKPSWPLLKPQKVDLTDAVSFQTKSAREGGFWTVNLHRVWSTVSLGKVRCDSNQASFIANQLNKFYRLNHDRSVEECKIKRSGPTEEFKSDSFGLARDEDSVRVWYKTSYRSALAVIILGLLPESLLLLSFQYFWFVPSASIVGILSGLAGLAIIGQGVVWLFVKKTLVASRDEVILSFGPFSWKKPIRLEPSTVREWIAQGLPRSDVETGRAILGYKDAHYDFKPFAKDLPSWAIADYLKHQLDVFYANQPKGEPTDQS